MFEVRKLVSAGLRSQLEVKVRWMSSDRDLRRSGLRDEGGENDKWPRN